MRKLLAMLLALALVFGMSASAFAAPNDQTITVNLGSQPETLDPQMNSASDGSNYIKHMFEGLMKYGWDGSGIVNGAAESYEISEDGLVWTLKIRDDAKWSDGKDLTAQDFEYSMKRLVNPENAAPYAGDMGKYLLNGLEIVEGTKPVEELGVKCIDEKTIELTLSGPCGWFLEILAFPTYYPVRQDMVEQYGDTWMTQPESLIGNGAYKLEAWTMDEEIVVVPNENYYAYDEIVAGKIVFKLIADPNAKLAAIRSGEIDFCDDYPTEELEAVKAEGIFDLTAQLGTYYVNFNNGAEPFDNALVRKAFTLALDTDYLSDNIMQGTYLPANNFVGPGFVDADGSDFHKANSIIDRSDYAANCAAAQEALAEAGYPNGEGFPTVSYATNVAGAHLPTAEAMVAMWKEVLNVNVEISQMDWNVFLDARRQGMHTMARDGWIADYGDPSNLLDLMTSYSGNNSTFYNNPEFDKMMQDVAASGDAEYRMKTMHEAEMLAIGTDYACAPVYYYAQQMLRNPKLSGYGLYATGEKLFHQAVLAD
ncbi:peptide ABC transporter substrate-binding protein [Eubacteriales bacterium OttesenSCG-928-N13]|nr:peptide ABC transporter substrate-binding protein [Eubacteriales bacterium OttesenSCG-928-N13]